MRKLFICAVIAFQTLLNAQAQDCPRIFQRGDTLYTDPAPQYQWFRDQNPIPNATKQWYLPPTKGNYAVQVSGTTQNFRYDLPLTEKSIAGRIIDERYEPIADAIVSVGNRSVKSDAKGQFVLKNIKLSGENAVVTITKAGFWKNVQRVHFFNQSEAPLTAMLEPLKVTNRFDATKGATISERGFFLTFPPNAVINESGQTYQGMVHLSLKRSFPNEEGFGLRMPGGDFSAIDANGQEKILVSYGFMSAEMQTPSGEQLRLSGEATLEFYQPWEQNQTAPDSMPLWHFDETKGMWMEEGIARKVGPRYVGTVKHFSSWNCDVPQNRATVMGTVLDCNGNPIPHKLVQIGERAVTSDSAGHYQRFVPSDITFQVFTSGDTINVSPLIEGEVRTLDTLRGNYIRLGSVGMVDTANVLTVHGIGLREYSIDGGVTYVQRDRQLPNIQNLTQGIAKDSLGCASPFRIYYAGRAQDCQIIDDSVLNQKYFHDNLIAALNDTNTVYSFGIMYKRLNSKGLSAYFPCLHRLFIEGLYPSDFNLEDVMELTNLQYFFIDSAVDSLGDVPESIGNLTRLKSLRLRGCGLTSIPSSIGQLSQLTVLNLEGNRITEIPDEISQLINLKELYIAGNQLTSLPASIDQLTDLDTLSLFNNRLEAIPVELIGPIINRNELDLSHNRLRTLPAEFGQLSRVEFLLLNNNQIDSLPDGFSDLAQIQILDLSNNQLMTLPDSIANLADTLQILKLEGNPIPVSEYDRLMQLLPNTSITF